jgi:hypothetical protein
MRYSRSMPSICWSSDQQVARGTPIMRAVAQTTQAVREP